MKGREKKDSPSFSLDPSRGFPRTLITFVANRFTPPKHITRDWVRVAVTALEELCVYMALRFQIRTDDSARKTLCFPKPLRIEVLAQHWNEHI